jgi:hypothetical protein
MPLALSAGVASKPVMKRSYEITVPYLAELTGIGESTIWENIRLLQSLLREDAQEETAEP